MVDVPERIWAVTDAGMVGTGRWVTQGTENPHGNVEYVRADLYELVKRERDELALAFNSSCEIRERLASRTEAAERLAGARVKDSEALIEKYASATKRNAHEITTMPESVIRQHFREFLDEALAALTEPAGEAEPVQVGWAYRDKRWDEDRWHVCGWEKPRESEGREVRPIFIFATPPASAIRDCATEGCDRPATVRFERGNVGSYYRHGCYMRVQALAGSAE